MGNSKCAARRVVIVRVRPGKRSKGTVTLGALTFACSLGREGRSARKREGDGATPTGTWQVVGLLYRADRAPRPRGGLPMRRITRDDGWCDASGDRNYNRTVRHPYPASAERLWRDDGLYDVIAVLAHNRVPRVQGRGSAIFMHVARPGYLPTEGCIGLALPHLRRVVAALARGARVRVL